MTTTLAPSLGAGLLFTQQGVGASPGYDMVDLRRASTAGLQEGVFASQSFEVTQRAAGAAMFVDIAASTAENGVAAVIQGDAVTGQGLYTIGPHSTFITEAIAASHATLPRVDRVVVEAKDNIHDATGSNLAQTRVITGTATAGATLDNLTGAAAVPSSALLLADVLVGATVTTITNSVIRDRRKWARGAYSRILRTAANLTTASATLALADGTNIYQRIECTGNPMRVTLDTDAGAGVASKQAKFSLWVDGGTTLGTERWIFFPSTSDDHIHITWDVVLSAGTHKIGLAWASVDGSTTMTLAENSGEGLTFTIEEIVRQNYANNTVTSG